MERYCSGDPAATLSGRVPVRALPDTARRARGWASGVSVHMMTSLVTLALLCGHGTGLHIANQRPRQLGLQSEEACSSAQVARTFVGNSLLAFLLTG